VEPRLKAKFHYVVQVADLVADLVSDQVSDKIERVCVESGLQTGSSYLGMVR